MNPEQIKEQIARALYEQHLRFVSRNQSVSLQEPWEHLKDHEKRWCYELAEAVALQLAKLGPQAWNSYLAFVRDHSAELLPRELR